MGVALDEGLNQIVGGLVLGSEVNGDRSIGLLPVAAASSMLRVENDGNLARTRSEALRQELQQLESRSLQSASTGRLANHAQGVDEIVAIDKKGIRHRIPRLIKRRHCLP